MLICNILIINITKDKIDIRGEIYMYTGIQFRGYKLFSEENIIEFDKITNVNVIIGKNNSGKSSLLDVIEMAYDSSFFEKQKKQIDLIRVNVPMTKNMVQSIFLGFPVLVVGMNQIIGKMWRIRMYGLNWVEQKIQKILVVIVQ